MGVGFFEALHQASPREEEEDITYFQNSDVIMVVFSHNMSHCSSNILMCHSCNFNTIILVVILL